MLAPGMGLAAEPAPAPAEHRIPVHVFAGEARGPYQTGTREQLWIDTRRDETATSDPNDKRHLMIQIWYPADVADGQPRARYVLSRQLYPKDEDAKWLDDAKAVLTTSVLNAPLARRDGPFPVLLYNPGGYHPPFSATFQTEYLASHGYVVVAIGHTGLTRIERFPDGYVYSPDHDRSEVTDEESKGWSEVRWFQTQLDRYVRLLMPVHVRDIGFVLDRLAGMNAEQGGEFYRRLDLEHVGSLGWSLGGALSLQASRDEPRVKAAVNLDGWLYTDVADTGTQRPVMQMHGDENYFFRMPERTAAERELSRLASMRSWGFYARSSADWYDVGLQRATHGHFSDRSLFEPAESELMHPRLAHEIVNRLTLEFFDKYLRGKTDTPLLSGKQSYPEVELLRRPPAPVTGGQ